MEYKVDLHVHSFISDGTYSPKEIIDIASKNGIKAIALTDHDSIEGIKEASEAAIKKNIDFLNGIEISGLYKNGRILHILGLGIDLENKDFLKVYNKMKLARENSIKKVIKKIEKQGINIDINILKENSTNKYLDRCDIHRYIMKNSVKMTAQEIWDKYLDPIPYEKDELIIVEDAIDIIKKANGVSFIAHYNKKIGFKGFTEHEMEENIKYLVGLGLNGVERYYPSYSGEDEKFLEYLIDKYNLMCSGGTDFHGENRPEISIGIGNDNLFIPYSIYENIINECNSIE